MTKSLILLNEWKLKVVISTKISRCKNIAIFLFWLKRFHGVFLFRYVKKKNEKEIFIAVLLKNLNFFIYGEFYIKNYRTIFFRTITCKYMSRNVVHGAAYITRKWICIFVLNAKLSAVNAQAIWIPKH